MFLVYSDENGKHLINLKEVIQIDSVWNKFTLKYQLRMSTTDVPGLVTIIEDKDKQIVNAAYLRIYSGIMGQRAITDVTDITDKWLETKDDE